MGLSIFWMISSSWPRSFSLSLRMLPAGVAAPSAIYHSLATARARSYLDRCAGSGSSRPQSRQFSPAINAIDDLGDPFRRVMWREFEAKFDLMTEDSLFVVSLKYVRQPG
jgi:hypothetical protein